MRAPIRGAGRLRADVRETRLPPMRCPGDDFLRAVRTALVDRRAGRLPGRAAFRVGRPFALDLALRFFAGLEDFLAMALVLVLGAFDRPLSSYPPEYGAARENLKL